MLRTTLSTLRLPGIGALWIAQQHDVEWVHWRALAVATAWVLWSVLSRQVRRHDKVVLLNTILRLASELEMEQDLRQVR